MKKLPRDKRSRMMLVAAGTVTATVVIWQTMIAPQQKALRAVSKRIQEQQTQVDTAQRLVQSAAQIQQNLEAARARLAAVEEQMASGDLYSWVIQTVSKFKEGYKVEIPQFSREVPCEVGLFARFPYRAALFNLRGTAHFHDFGRFLADFENRFPYLRVQNLELEPVANPAAATPAEAEKLAFRMEIVALVNPHLH